MRVKRLEVHGFKSFKDRTVIHFDHEVTGIVGPNGCGKSNIVDAFFWVMGEMSYKHIRGTGSDDLIFNGSSKYNPLGMAEATLVLETATPDTESAPEGATAEDVPVHLKSKEIAVTRRVYRGGEGEYFINGVSARLKDIRDLFLDTGVGTKGYSVIEQGQIGRIVNSKPEERRVLIEDAAGIAKYKARKVESLRKLEAAEANLSRLNDVITEIQRNLEALEKQAQKARKYNEYKNELLEKEMTWGRRKHKLLKERLQATESAKIQLEQEITGLRASLQTLENEISAKQLQEIDFSKQAEDLQPELQRMSEKLSHEQGALNLAKKRQEDLTTQLESMDAEKKQLSSTLETLQADVAQTEYEDSQLAQNSAEAAADLRAHEELHQEVKSQIEYKRAAIADGKSELLKKIQQNSEWNSQASKLAAMMESTLARMAAAQEEKSRIEERLASHQTSLIQIAEMTKSLVAEEEGLENQSEEFKSKLDINSLSTKDAQKESEDAKRKLGQLESKLNSLEELDRAYEGLKPATREVLQWGEAHSDGTKRISLLADSFGVKEGYEDAIQGWLEHQIDTLIVSDLSLIPEAIGFIQQGKLGRAQIQLPKNEVAPHLSSENAPSIAGVELIGPARDFVELRTEDASAREKILGLLQQVFVVKKIPTDPSILQAVLATPANCSFVDLEGTVLDASGNLRTGGAIEEDSAHLLKRRRAIEDMRNELPTLEARVKSCQDQLDALQVERAHLEESLKLLQVKQKDLALKINSAESDHKQLTARILECQSDLVTEEQTIARSSQEKSEIEAKISAIQEQLKDYLANESQIKNAIEANEIELGGLVQLEATRMQDLQKVQARNTAIQERSKSIHRELESKRSLLTDRKQRIDEIDKLLTRANSEFVNQSGAEKEIIENISVLTKEKAVLEDQFRAVRDQIAVVRAQMRESQEKSKEVSRTLDENSSSLNQKTVDLSLIQSDLEHLRTNLQEKYGPECFMQLDFGNPIVTEEMNEEEEKLLSEEVERLRERIRRLGEVNPLAAEEYDRENERFQSLSTQKLDLVQSISNLKEAIEHINKTSEDRFRKAFEAINDRFIRLFPIIFGGGKAELSLIPSPESSNILDAGVDIMAQPPGKNIVNISVLSGGEKALTALSLVFAIFMVKPSPFCILDEVDAPLDDANVGKFNTLLKEMSKRTQFIIITHNKKTMELNDTLYGVTMEEPGVSKMVSIQLQ